MIMSTFVVFIQLLYFYTTNTIGQSNNNIVIQQSYSNDGVQISNVALTQIFGTPLPSDEDRRKLINNYKPATPLVDTKHRKCVDYKDAGYLCTDAIHCREGTVLVNQVSEFNIRFGDDGDVVNIEKEIANSKCLGDREVCCRLPDRFEPVTEVRRYQPKCGRRNVNSIGVGVTIKGDPDASGRTQFGEFPSTCLLAKTKRNGRLEYVGVASLIHESILLTAAHKVADHKGRDKLIARCGEWDARHRSEPLNHQERKVVKIITHPAFNAKSLANDTALLFVDERFKLSEHIDTACLPKDEFGPNSYKKEECFATGWGQERFHDRSTYQTILRKIRLNLFDDTECQRILNNALNYTYTEVGEEPVFQLDSSFLCALGKKDTCTGDGGGPLVCPGYDDYIDPYTGKRSATYIQAGIVAWGVGCGNDRYPAVYVDVSTQLCFIKWAAQCVFGRKHNPFKHIDCQWNWAKKEMERIKDETEYYEKLLKHRDSRLSSTQRLANLVQCYKNKTESWKKAILRCRNEDDDDGSVVVDISAFQRATVSD